MLLPRSKDRRVKLTEEDKQDIRDRHAVGESTRSIARVYEHKCTRRTIQYVINPTIYEELRRQYRERRKDGRYKPERDKWAQTMREHRAYKKTIENEK